MQSGLSKRILEARFRASPRYELVLFDRLPREQQERLADLRKDPDFYGVLLPRDSPGQGIKSVSRDTALLYLTLQQPGLLPAYSRAILGEGGDRTVAQLVLDGVLEIERDAAFIGGPEACGAIFDGSPSAPAAGEGAIARLSLEALRYAQSLPLDDVARLSARLYFYNRKPASWTWRRRLATPEAVSEHLGIDAGGAISQTLKRAWRRVSLTPPFDGWLMWRSRRRLRSSRKPGATFKLYVSPDCSHLRPAFRATLEALTELGALSFKVGKDVFGLLRPDKIVAYFADLRSVRRAADALRGALGDVPAHGVPFTADLGAGGLLSWGVDPPRAEQPVLPWQERESWRLWITNRLAAALVAARAGRADALEPWRFALQRLRLEGVDTDLWTPDPTLWRDAPGAEADG